MSSIIPADPASLDLQKLNYELDRVRARAFIGDHAAFIGSIMCSLQFVWSRDVETAATNGETFWWNPDFFLSLSVDTNRTVLAHELWHVAKMHMLRGENKPDKDAWQFACDMNINNMLRSIKNNPYSFTGIEWGIYDGNGAGYTQIYGNMAEEEIYKLVENKLPKLEQKHKDLQIPAPKDKNAVINCVQRAIIQDKLANGEGAGKGREDVDKWLGKFLEPVVEWESHLFGLFTDLVNGGYSWKRPNRRYAGRIYMPSHHMVQDRLAKLNYYLDESGSTTNRDVLRFNSEFKYIKDVFNPKELNHITFTDQIEKVTLIKEEDDFDAPKRGACGGTDLRPVADHINETQPTAAVIFSDLDCSPMPQLDIDIPIIWIVTGNRFHTPDFGEVIHLPPER